MDVQGVSLSSTCSLDLPWVSLSPASRMDEQHVTISTARKMDVQCTAGCLPLYCQEYGHAGCNPFLNAGLSGIQSVRYGNKQKFRCRNQSSTGIRGPCLVAEFRYRTEILEQC